MCTVPLKGAGGVPHDFPIEKKQKIGTRFRVHFTLVVKIQAGVQPTEQPLYF